MADYSVKQLANAAYKAGFRGPLLITAVAISLAENPGRQLRATNHNTNGTVDRGPWQINSATQTDIGAGGRNPFDLQENADIAYRIYQRQGFNAWTNYRNGRYKMYTKVAGKGSIKATSANDPQHVLTLPGDKQQEVVGAGVHNVASAASAIPTLIGHILSPEFWKMVGMGALALILILAGVAVMMETNKDVRRATVAAAAA